MELGGWGWREGRRYSISWGSTVNWTPPPQVSERPCLVSEDGPRPCHRCESGGYDPKLKSGF